jgi:multimeric flavodoxin WrbA
MNGHTALLISGSPRPGGNTAHALGIVGKVLAQTGYDVESIQLSQLAFGSCIACEKCRRDKVCTGIVDGLTPYYDTLLSAEMWVLGSPVYNYNVTSWMKAFIDRLYCFYEFDADNRHLWSSRISDLNKKAVTLVVGEQMTDKDMGFAADALRLPLEALGVDILRSFVFRGYFDRGSLRSDSKRMIGFERELAESVSRV